MRKSLLATIAGAALIAGGGLAAAQQRMEGSPGGANGAQGSSKGEPGGAVHERQSGAMQNPAQGRSTAAGEERQRSGHPGATQGPAQGRSTATGEEGHRAGRPGAMQGPAQGRSTAAGEERQRSGHSGAMQSPAQGRSSTEQSRGGFTEQRSVGSTALSPDQKTKLHETIAGGDVRHVDHVDFSLSVGIRVPDTVTFYDVPETIVDIVPQYRGFRYILVRDELVIIDPDTLEIVAVLLV